MNTYSLKRGLVEDRHALPDPRLTAYHTRMVMELVSLLYRNVSQEANQEVKKFIAARFQQYPPQPMTKEQAALHEAGHYIAFEAEGMIATTAEIHGSAGGRKGWGGIAYAAERPMYNAQPITPGKLISEARAAIAGPWAEFSLGGGDFSDSISEIIEVHFLAACAAERLGCRRHQVLDHIVVGTAATVNAHRTGIEKIAELLGNQKRIFRNPSIRSVLKSAATTPVSDLHPAPQRHIDELGELLTGAVPGIDELILQVTTGRAA